MSNQLPASPHQMESLNDELFTSLSIEELEERLAMEGLDVRGEMWTCECDGRLRALIGRPCEVVFMYACVVDWE